MICNLYKLPIRQNFSPNFVRKFRFNVMNDLEKLRNEYSQKPFGKIDVARDPISQFKNWFDEVLKSEVYEPTACTLSTVNSEGRVSGRIVLLKRFDEKGFVFFTNYNSRKSLELEAHPNGALTFFWKELERQIRIEGTVDKISAEDSTYYFSGRPYGSKIGAWASPQSQVIPDRQFLEQRESEFSSKYENDVPRPDHWGGYRLSPDYIEFWQGRPNRLHDRITYSQTNDNWVIERLAP